MLRLQRLAYEFLFLAIFPVLVVLYPPPADAQTPRVAVQGVLDVSSVFLQAPAYQTGGVYPTAVVVMDVNHDGIPDLLTTQCGAACSGLVGVLLGNGDGTYQTAQTYASGGFNPSGLAVMDVNGDGNPDVVVSHPCANAPAGGCAGNGTVALLLGNFDGTFQPAQSFDTGAGSASSVAVADVNGDHKLDLLVTNQCTPVDCSSQVTVMLGNGNGTFQAPQHYSAGYSALSIVVADVNHDGKPDVVVANLTTSATNFQGAVSVLLGHGDGSFQPPQTFASGSIYAHAVVVADLDKDGIPDVAVLHECPTDTCGVGDGVVGILLGNGNGTFRTPRLADPGGNMSLAMTVADVNGDSILDLVIANGAQAGNTNQYVNGSVAVLLGNGDGSFVLAHTYNSMGWTPSAVAVANLRAHGGPDIVVANQALSSVDSSAGSLAVMLGHGDGSFQAAPVYGAGGLIGGAAVSIADLNADGKADLVVTNDACADLSCSGVIGVKLGNGDGTFLGPQTYQTGGIFPRGVAIGDVNRDGIQDILVANQCSDYQTCAQVGSNGSVAVLLGLGSGTFGPAQTFGSGGVSASSLVLQDVNGDGKLDILVTNQCLSSNDCTNGSVGVLLGNGDGSFQIAVTYASGAYIASASVAADVNGDGVTDLLVANKCLTSACVNDGQIAVFLGNMDGTLTAPNLFDTGSLNPYSLALKDVTGDNIPDIVVANQDSIGVLIGNGDGTFQTPLLIPAMNGYQGQLVVADFDGDGKPDIATEAGLLLLGNGDGTFTTTTGQLPPGPGIAAGDLNGDNDPDLAIGGVTVLLNTAPQAKLTPTITWPAPASISYGTALSGTQLDATANVPGTFLYSPASGTVLSAGSQPLTLIFLPADTAHYTTAAGQVLLVVNQATTSTTLASSLNPSLAGQPVTFTATVSGPSLAGTITFTDGGNPIGNPVALSNGVASLIAGALVAGAHSIAASYSGDANHLGSTSPLLQQAVNNRTVSSIAVTSSLSPSSVGQSVTLTATVTGTSPTGTILFTDGGNPIGNPIALSGGKGSLTTSALLGGSHSIAASYSGDSNNLGSASANFVQTVGGALSIVVMTSSPNPVAVAQPVTFNVLVSGFAPGGTVTLMDGATVLASSHLTLVAGNGSATLQITPLSAGPHSITANYSGDANNLPGASVPLNFVLPHAAQPYIVSDLGSGAFGLSINNNGQVTGELRISSSVSHAFLMSPPYTQIVDLSPPGSGNSSGQGINSLGQVTGVYATPTGTGRAFLTSAPYTVLTDLGDLGGGSSGGSGINDSGHIAGSSTAPNGRTHAFLWDGTMHDLGTQGGVCCSSAGFAINNSDQISGATDVASGNSDVFLYANGTMNDLGGIGGCCAHGYGINASGKITGDAYASHEHAILWDGTMHDLGTLGDPFTYSVGFGINASGQITGTTQVNSVDHAILYTAVDGLVDLNTLLPAGSGWVLSRGMAINDAGQITGYGTRGNDPNAHAFVMTPPPQPMGAFLSGTAVAKPSSGTAAAVFAATYNNSGNQPVAVNYSSVDGTAHAGVDYGTTAGTLTFAPGVTTQTITVPVTGGARNLLNLSFSVELRGAGNSLLASATGTILVPPNPPISYTLSASPASLAAIANSSPSSALKLHSDNGVSETAHLTAVWTTAPAAGVSFSPSSWDVTIPSNGSVSATVTVTTLASPSIGTFVLRVTATSASGVTRTVDLSVVVSASLPATTCGCTKTGPFVSPRVKALVAAVPPDPSKPEIGLGPGGLATVTTGPDQLTLTTTSPDQTKLIDGATHLTHYGFSPNGQLFVLITQPSSGLFYLDLYSIPLKRRLGTSSPLNTNPLSWGFSPDDDNRYFVVTSSTNLPQHIDIFVYDTQTGSLALSYTAGGYSSASGPAWSDETDVDDDDNDSSSVDKQAGGWGFSPDGNTFLTSFVTGENATTGTSVYSVSLWNLMRHSNAPVISESYQDTGFWQFSPCGDLFMWVHQAGGNPAASDFVDFTFTSNGRPYQEVNFAAPVSPPVAPSASVATKPDGSEVIQLIAMSQPSLASPQCTDSFSMHSPANITLTDTIGRRTGFDPGTGGVLNQIPGGSYTGVGTEPQTVTVPYIAGFYVLDAFGLSSLTSPQPYTLTFAETDASGDVIDRTNFSGMTSAGLDQRFAVTVGSGPVQPNLLGTSPPALAIASSHSGNFTQGQLAATYTVTVSNAAGAGITGGTVTVTETAPAGLTLVSMDGGAAWNCTVLPVCTTGNLLNAGASYPAIKVTVNVLGSAPAQMTNQVSVMGGGSAGASAGDPTSIVPFSCDINGDQATNVADVQLLINEALGVTAAVHDLNHDGAVNVADVQKEINAALGLGCLY